MKHIISKIISFICVTCMVFAVNTFVFAADAGPEILVKMNSSNKAADISIKNAGTMIYSVQLKLNIGGGNTNYTLVCDDKNMYGTTKTDGSSVILYIDSTEILNGSKEIKLAKLSAGKEMKISNTAELTVVDYSMRPQSYSKVKVNVSSDNSNDGSGSGGSGSSGSGNNNSGQIAGGGIYNPVIGSVSAAGPKTFSDVGSDHWAKSSIDYVVGRGLFEGTSETTFGPSQNMTRAMYVVVLNRFGTRIDPKWQIPCDTLAQFDDITADDWYADAVAWAGGTGLVSGVGNNCFAPNLAVTREQIAVMTVNFAKLCGLELPSNVQSVEFADEDGINDWALEAVHIAQQAGIIEGRDNNIFAPSDTATRAEVAAIMYRLVGILN